MWILYLTYFSQGRTFTQVHGSQKATEAQCGLCGITSLCLVVMEDELLWAQGSSSSGNIPNQLNQKPAYVLPPLNLSKVAPSSWRLLPPSAALELPVFHQVGLFFSLLCQRSRQHPYGTHRRCHFIGWCEMILILFLQWCMITDQLSNSTGHTGYGKSMPCVFVVFLQLDWSMAAG